MIDPSPQISAASIVLRDDYDVIAPLSPSSRINTEADGFWTAFGFTRRPETPEFTVPDQVVVIETDSQEARHNLTAFAIALEVWPALVTKVTERQQRFWRVSDPALASTLARSVPNGVRVLSAGEPITLPSADEWQPNEDTARSIAELTELTAVEVSRVAKPDLQPETPENNRNPLNPFSLRGESAEFRRRAVAATPLLGGLCLNGQVTAWYAAPNTGKTLIALNLLIEAVKDGRIAGGNVYYINADDSSEGMATKMELMDDLGVHTLIPGFKGFVPQDLAPKFHAMAERDQARGVLVLIDTTKKFVSLMKKDDVTLFAAACRRVAMGGGAVLNLAHTNKNTNSDGSPRYSGTTDLVDDADAAYTIQAIDAAADTGERVVEFTCFKQRGDSVQSAAFAYATENGVSYAERLASVRPVDPETLDQFKRVETLQADEEVIAVIAACIAEGINTKMVLGKEAAKRAGVPARRAYRLVDRYTGDDPVQHRWRFTVRERGAKRFELLPPPD